jgi:hypothetical protein
MAKTVVSRTSGLPQAKLPTNNDAQWIDCGQCEVAGVIPQDLALGFQKGSSVPSVLCKAVVSKQEHKVDEANDKPDQHQRDVAVRLRLRIICWHDQPPAQKRLTRISDHSLSCYGSATCAAATPNCVIVVFNNRVRDRLIRVRKYGHDRNGSGECES